MSERVLRLFAAWLKLSITSFVCAAITIGFSPQNYSVNECDGQVSITVKIIGSVSLQREVVVYLSTSDQTAYGDFLCQLTNQSDTTIHCSYICLCSWCQL